MISVENLSKTYGEQHAIDQINFEIGRGEIVGFLGPNGAGKTTTMKIITCYMQPSSGTVDVDGLSIFKDSLEIRRKIGYLPEHNPLYHDMYVHEYLTFVGRLFKMHGNELKKRTAEVIGMTGLGPEQHKKIGMLSKGYRQRVGLSQALIHDPEILILDEPTTGLDPNQIVDIRNMIREISKEKTIIFSTHILPEVEAIANRVIIIKDGKIVADDPISILRTDQQAGQFFRVAFEQPGFDFAGIRSLNAEITVKTEDEKTFTITVPQDLDFRKVLFEQSMAQNNPIDLLRKETLDLEDIFRTLTR